MKIGIAAKLTKIEWDMHRLGWSWDEVIASYERQEKNIQQILESHQRQKESIDSICSRIPSVEIVDVLGIQEERVSKPEFDMLISVGGDNFFQMCSHLFPDAYLIGVNSDPVNSYGALLNFNYETLLENLNRIIVGAFITENWARINTNFNGNKIEKGICTVSLSIKATDMISRYLLKKNGESEEQKATGILVVCGAGTGNGAWYRNAGLYLPMIKSRIYATVATEFSRSLLELRTLTREPMRGEDCSYRWLNLPIKQSEELTLIYWSNDPSELSIDSINRYEIKEGDKLTFRVSDKPLKVVASF